MELHPTPESWRIALLTAIGALVIGTAAITAGAVIGGATALITAGVIALAALATLVPALGTISASVDADARGVTVRRLGRTCRYAWGDVVGIHVAERRASVPDGTEYHWVVPHRRAHVVAVPCLDLADGRVRQLPALAVPASGPTSVVASDHAATLRYFRTLAIGEPERALSRTA
jgi:hypothetical protein